MPEVSAETLEILNKSYEMLNRLNNKPESRVLLEDAVKVHFPEVRTEREVQETVAKTIEQRVQEALKPQLERIEAFNAAQDQQAQQRVEQDLSSAFERMKSERGFTDEGIAAVKQLMVDRSIADPNAAAALFSENNPKPSQEAPGWTPSHWNIEQAVTDHDVKGLFANEDAWGDQMASKVLNEIRVGQAA